MLTPDIIARGLELCAAFEADEESIDHEMEFQEYAYDHFADALREVERLTLRVSELETIARSYQQQEELWAKLGGRK